MNTLEEKIYQACLASAKSMGNRIKELSWFGKNKQLNLLKRITLKNVISRFRYTETKPTAPVAQRQS